MVATGKTQRSRTLCLHALVMASAAAIVAFECYDRIDVPNLMSRLGLHNMILNGTAPSPYRYRVLVPFFTELLGRFLGLFIERGQVFQLSYLIYDYLAILFSLWAMYIYLRLWFSGDQSLIGALFAALSMVLTLRDNYYQPWSLIEPGTLALGLYLIYKRKDTAFAVLVLVASLNRETGIILPFAYLVSRLDILKARSMKQMMPILTRTGVYGCLWLATFYGLRLLRGSVA